MGTMRPVSCAFTLRHEALNGTWNCNVSAEDSYGEVAYGYGSNSVDQLIAVEGLEDMIHFG